MYSLNGIPLKKIKRTDGHTDGQTTNERTDGQSDYIMPQILFGGIKKDLKVMNLVHYTSPERPLSVYENSLQYIQKFLRYSVNKEGNSYRPCALNF